MAKLFVREAGTASMMRLFEPLSPGAKIVSALTTLEVRSAIRRRQKSKDLTDDDAGQAIASLSSESEIWKTVSINDEVLALGSALIDRRILRALDAIQLATAILCNAELDAEDVLVFVSSDDKLLLAAEAEGLSIWNPSLA